MPTAAMARSVQQRARGIRAVEPGHAAHQHADGDAEDDALERRGEQRGDASGGRRADELGAARLLVGARVTHREEGVHQADHEPEESEQQEELERVGLGALRRAAEHQDRRAHDDESDDARSLVVGAVGLGDGCVTDHLEHGEEREPHDDLHPVAAEPQPQQGGQGVHRTPSRLDRAGSSISSW